MKREFNYLLAATILALVAIALFVQGEHGKDGVAMDALLLPGLADTVNGVDRVDIATAGNTVIATLLKSDGQWQVEQMGKYAADWPKIQGLLSGLAQARVIELKTDKPEYYSRLGVEDIDSESAASVLVTLNNNDESTGILIGKKATGRTGQFVRLQGAAASALLDRTLDVPAKQLDWADKRIIDINASEVAEVEIIHPQESRIFITKISADQTDFDLVGLPPDREIKSTWAVNSLGSTLSLLDLESVRPAADVDWQTAVRMRVLTFSGLEIMAEMIDVDSVQTLRLSASHPAAQVVNYQNNPGEKEGSGEEIVQAAIEDVAARVAEINQRVDGWAYGIAGYKFDAMVKTQEDILKPEDSS